MRQKIFAICDMEEAYALRLMEYMLEKVKLPYTYHLFTRVEELEKFARQEEIAILLIRGRLWRRCLRRLPDYRIGTIRRMRRVR